MLNPVLHVVHVCIHKDYRKKVRVHSNLAPTALAGIPCKKPLHIWFLTKYLFIGLYFSIFIFLQLFILITLKIFYTIGNIIFFPSWFFQLKKSVLRNFSMLAILMAVWIYHNLFNQLLWMDIWVVSSILSSHKCYNKGYIKKMCSLLRGK